MFNPSSRQKVRYSKRKRGRIGFDFYTDFPFGKLSAKCTLDGFSVTLVLAFGRSLHMPVIVLKTHPPGFSAFV
jgi:hypothetical protein